MIQRAIIAGLTSTGVDVADLRDLAGGRHAPRPEDAGPAAGVHVGRSSADPELDRDPRLRVAREPDDGGAAEGGREALQPPGAPARDVRGGGGHDLPGAGPRELRAGHPRRDRPRARCARRRFRVAIDYGHSPAAFTLPLVLGPLGVEAIGMRGFYVEDDTAGELDPLDARRDRDRRRRRPRRRPRPRCRAAAARRRARGVGPGRARPAARRPAARARRPRGPDRRPVTATGRGRASSQGSSLEIVRTPHSLSELTRAATRGRRRPRGGADRRVRLPGRRPGLRRGHRALQGARAARGQERPALGARRRAAAADARPPRGAVPVEPQGPRHAAAQRAARAAAARPDGRRQGLRRARLGAGRCPTRTSPSSTLYAEGETEELSEELADEVAASVDADRAGRRGRAANSWSKPQAEVDPSAPLLLQSVLSRRKARARGRASRLRHPERRRSRPPHPRGGG